MKRRLIVGVSGASGAPLAIRLLKEIKKCDWVESHLIISKGAALTIQEECKLSLEQAQEYADICYDNSNLGAAIASGSFETMGMIVIPCSMKTAAGVAHGYSDNLLLRAADVVLKEKRRLVLVVRESPLSKIHLDNLTYLAGQSNVFIMPPVLGYYHHPNNLDEMEQQIVGRILDKFDLEAGLKRWEPDYDKRD